jgi:hypothetical protein
MTAPCTQPWSESKLFLVALLGHARPIHGAFDVGLPVIDVFRGPTNALLKLPGPWCWQG